MFRPPREAVRRVGAFPCATKVEHARKSDRGQSHLILRRQITEMVGSKELPPAQTASVLCAIAAEVPEVGGALKAPYAIWMAMHARLVHSGSANWTISRSSCVLCSILSLAYPRDLEQRVRVDHRIAAPTADTRRSGSSRNTLAAITGFHR
jgi:hypothetical protein